MPQEWTERDKDLRCTSTEVEREGRTHLCRLATPHDDEPHWCICGRKWKDTVPA